MKENLPQNEKRNIQNTKPKGRWTSTGKKRKEKKKINELRNRQEKQRQIQNKQ